MRHQVAPETAAVLGVSSHARAREVKARPAVLRQAAALAALVVPACVLALWSLGLLAPREPTLERPSAVAQLPRVELEPGPAGPTFAASQPLFAADRRAATSAAPAGTAAAAPATGTAMPVLHGITRVGGIASALLSSPTDPRPQLVSVGQAHSGWTVQSIDAASVELRTGEQVVLLQLRAPLPAAPSTLGLPASSVAPGGAAASATSGSTSNP